MNNNELDDFCNLFAITADYYGRNKSRDSAMIYWNALQAYPFDLIKQCFESHIRTNKFMPMVSDVVESLSSLDGRPEPQQAWAIVAASLNDENVTVVRTQEMATAFGVALGLADDHVAARMAFLEAYKAEVSAARSRGVPAQWQVSLGHDKAGRDGPLLAAVAAGRLPTSYVEQFLIGETARNDLLRLAPPDAIKAKQLQDLIRDFGGNGIVA